jgi:hypothetical protein
MTVAELIVLLQKMPPDKLVFAEGDQCLYEPMVEYYQNPIHADDSYVLIYPRK